MTIVEALLNQAKSCDALGSPFNARVCRLLAERMKPGGLVADRLLSWPGDLDNTGDATAVRIIGALHMLVLSGADPDLAAVYPPHQADDETLWAAISAALETRAEAIDRFLDSPPQTNEIRRSCVMISVGNWLTERFDLPIRLSELGASAGLNLHWDRYAMLLGGRRYGPEDAAMVLEPESRGDLPPVAPPQVVERRGVDLRPFDLTDPEQVLRLRSYIWPDQAERHTRTLAALALPPAPVDQSDAAAWLESRLARPMPGTCHLLYHTIAWQYFPQATQAACRATIEAAGAKADDRTPLAWLGMEADGDFHGAGLRLRLWPGDESWDLGRVDFHGRWLDWRPRREA